MPDNTARVISKGKKSKAICPGQAHSKSGGENKGQQSAADHLELNGKHQKILQLGYEQKSKSRNGRSNSYVWQRALQRTLLVLKGSPQSSSGTASWHLTYTQREENVQTNPKPRNIIHKLVALLLYIQESILKFQRCTFYVTDSATVVVPLLSLTTILGT